MVDHVEGIVVEVDGEIVKVRIKHHGECHHCGACGGDLAMLLEARCEGGAKVGDRVLVDLPETEGLKSAFVVYLLPLIGAAAGWGAGELATWLLDSGAQWPQPALCVLAVVGSLFYLKRYDRLLARRTALPTAVRVGGNIGEVTTKRD